MKLTNLVKTLASTSVVVSLSLPAIAQDLGSGLDNTAKAVQGGGFSLLDAVFMGLGAIATVAGFLKLINAVKTDQAKTSWAVPVAMMVAGMLTMGYLGYVHMFHQTTGVDAAGSGYIAPKLGGR